MKKRNIVSIKINFTNRWLYTLIAVGIFLIIGVGVYAIAPGIIPNPGHNISEMSVPNGCTAGQVLSYDGTNWICKDLVSSGGMYGFCTVRITWFGRLYQDIAPITSIPQLPPTSPVCISAVAPLSCSDNCTSCPSGYTLTGLTQQSRGIFGFNSFPSNYVQTYMLYTCMKN